MGVCAHLAPCTAPSPVPWTERGHRTSRKLHISRIRTMIGVAVGSQGGQGCLDAEGSGQTILERLGAEGSKLRGSGDKSARVCPACKRVCLHRRIAGCLLSCGDDPRPKQRPCRCSGRNEGRAHREALPRASCPGRDVSAVGGPTGQWQAGRGCQAHGPASGGLSRTQQEGKAAPSLHTARLQAGMLMQQLIHSVSPARSWWRLRRTT